jgi:hypothetical protein
VNVDWPDRSGQELELTGRCRMARGLRDACPVVPGKRYLDWRLDDPAGRSPAEGRPICTGCLARRRPARRGPASRFGARSLTGCVLAALPSSVTAGAPPWGARRGGGDGPDEPCRDGGTTQ